MEVGRRNATRKKNFLTKSKIELPFAAENNSEVDPDSITFNHKLINSVLMFT